jgi:hypothetical protein
LGADAGSKPQADSHPFQEVGNGDYLSIALDGKFVYLSHDDGEGHRNEWREGIAENGHEKTATSF